MGGVLALRYALMYPGEVSKVVACDMPGMTSLEASKPLWRDRIAMFREDGVDELAQKTVKRWFPDPCPQGVKEEALKQTQSCTLQGYEVCAEGIMGFDYTEELAKIDKEEVLVIRGENDEAVGPKEVLEDVSKRIKGSQFLEMKGVGHLPPMHGAEDFERIMLGFLGTLEKQA